MLKDRDTLTVAADGSSLGNPGPGGWCFYIDIHNWAAGGLSRGVTNNQMELTAVLMALRSLKNTDIEFLLDSQYVINCVTKWHHGWRRNNWKTSSGSSVSNREIIEEITATIESRKKTGITTSFKWVRGHAGDSLNEAADFRARAAAKKALSNRCDHLVGPLS